MRRGTGRWGWALTVIAGLAVASAIGRAQEDEGESAPGAPEEAPAGESAETAPTAEVRAAPVDNLPNCTTAACHGPLLDKPVIHGAVSMGECSDCHEGLRPEKGESTRCKSRLKFRLTNIDPDLCLDCHEMEKQTPLHAAVVASGCVTCHDPHSGERKKLLLEDTPSELCAYCHDQGEGENVHEAIQSGECTDCHDPHSGVERPLLRTAKRGLCSECHDVEGEILGDKRHKHPPVVEARCPSCHNPHKSEHRALLKFEPKMVCLRCHGVEESKDREDASKLKISLDSKHEHEALNIGDCLDCHRPHASNWLKLLRKPQPPLCHDCHDRKDTDDYVHSAVRLGQCSTCHDPHGGTRPPIMRFETNRDMCFACHADDLTGRPHVHNPARGDCMFCHLPHGSKNLRNLKEGGNALCLSCHFAIRTDYQFKHQALDKYGCIACHDPHGSSHQKFTIKAIGELCRTCHDEIAGLHVPGSEMAGPRGHPLEGPRDPKRPGEPFTCVSCHNPHGSEFASLLRAGGEGMAVCAYCHFRGDKRAGLPGPLPAIGGAPASTPPSEASGSVESRQ